MNVRPGRKQARMWGGWFIQDGERNIQPMTFLPNHSQNPNAPKDIKAVLVKCGLYQTNLQGKCKKKCESNAYCNKQILDIQPDFTEQKSLAQETIEAAGHLCFFLLKFHCELNPIKYFWGIVKKYLCNNCNDLFDRLKFTESIGFSTHIDHLSLGTSAFSLNGSLSGRTWVSSGIITSKDIQLQEEQITQVYSREHSYTFRLMHI
jgi:hypothetical protein